MWRWVVRGILVVVLAALILRRYHQEPSVGLPVGVVTNECAKLREDLGGAALRQIRLRITPDGTILLNSEPVKPDRLAEILRLVYATRREKVLYLDPSESVSYQQVIKAIEASESAVPEIKVLVVTSGVRKDCEEVFNFRMGGAGE